MERQLWAANKADRALGYAMVAEADPMTRASHVIHVEATDAKAPRSDGGDHCGVSYATLQLQYAALEREFDQLRRATDGSGFAVGEGVNEEAIGYGEIQGVGKDAAALQAEVLRLEGALSLLTESLEGAQAEAAELRQDRDQLAVAAAASSEIALAGERFRRRYEELQASFDHRAALVVIDDEALAGVSTELSRADIAVAAEIIGDEDMPASTPELDGHRGLVPELEHSLAIEKAKNASVESACCQLEVEKAALEAALRMSEESREASEESLRMSEAAVAALEVDARELQTSLKVARLDSEAERLAREQAEKEARRQGAAATEAEGSHAEAVARLEVLLGSHSMLQRAAEELQSTVRELQAEKLRVSQQEVAEKLQAQEHQDHLESAHAALQAEHTALLAEHTALLAEHMALLAEHSNLQAELNDNVIVLAELRDKLVKLQSTHLSTEAASSVLREANVAFQANVDSLQEDLRAEVANSLSLRLEVERLLGEAEAAKVSHAAAMSEVMSDMKHLMERLSASPTPQSQPKVGKGGDGEPSQGHGVVHVASAAHRRGSGADGSINQPNRLMQLLQGQRCCFQGEGREGNTPRRLRDFLIPSYQ